jgi:pimeloyl-ACP methyl ester carboxylesterase
MIRSIAMLFFVAQLAGCGTHLKAHVVHLDSRSSEVVTAGAGTVTVVFESGLGNDWTTWDEVASEVSLHARVFAYSRPGYGGSEPVATPRDPAHIVAELRALLASTGQSPPYLLVGHSNGGGYMELFAKAHPDEVMGVVLVEPRHRDFLAACTQAEIESCGIPESALAGLPAVEGDEYRAYARAPGEIDAAGSFGSHPLRVLTATSHPASPAWESLWQSMNASLAAESSQGRQILFPGAGHMLQHDRPKEVAGNIVALLPAQ